MRSMRRPVIAGVLAASAFAVLQTTSSGSQPAREYVVVYERGVSAAKGQDAVKDAGGKVVSVNKAIGVATVRSANKDFAADAAREGALVGAAPNRAIGHSPKAPRWQPQWGIERSGANGQGEGAGRRAPGGAVRRRPVGHEDDRRHSGRLLPQAARLQGRARRHHRHRRRRVASGHRAELRPRAVASTSSPTCRTSTARASSRTAMTRRTSTRAATARTSPAPSARRSTASASPASRRRSTSSTSAPARTRATSSCSRPSTRSRTRATTASTS